MMLLAPIRCQAALLACHPATVSSMFILRFCRFLEIVLHTILPSESFKAPILLLAALSACQVHALAPFRAEVIFGSSQTPSTPVACDTVIILVSKALKLLQDALKGYQSFTIDNANGEWLDFRNEGLTQRHVLAP
jgi:hypothetical protein